MSFKIIITGVLNIADVTTKFITNRILMEIRHMLRQILFILNKTKFLIINIKLLCFLSSNGLYLFLNFISGTWCQFPPRKYLFQKMSNSAQELFFGFH